MSTSNSTNPNPAGVRSDDTPQTFWERLYAGKTKPTAGRPSSALTHFVEGRAKGRALELGCARGDDAVWLAEEGWTVTGVDVSETALEAARLAAEARGVGRSISFERHDLSQSFPEGRFDLVIAMFLQSPVPFGRTAALRRAAEAVNSGGLLLVVTHGERSSWSWSSPETPFPTAEAELAELALAPTEWREVFVGPRQRKGRGPAGEEAVVTDTILAIERL